MTKNHKDIAAPEERVAAASALLSQESTRLLTSCFILSVLSNHVESVCGRDSGISKMMSSEILRQQKRAALLSQQELTLADGARKLDLQVHMPVLN